MQFRHRSTEKELLDNEAIDSKDLYQNLAELNRINKLLGGYAISIEGLETILELNNPVRTILDIGFGGGDSIKQMAQYALSKNLGVFFYGVDKKKECVSYAKSNLASIENKYLICEDYLNMSSAFLQKIDVIHCSLFLHHLTNHEIVALFKLSKANQCILLANDLHRNQFAYYSIKILTFLFSKSKLVKHDAPVSVKRGFKKSELVDLLKKSGFSNFTIKWSWAFRYRIIAIP